MLELAKTVAAAMGVESKLKLVEARNEVVHAYATHAKAQKHFGDLIRNVPLETGVERMAVWAKQAGVRHGQTFEAIEVRKNLPPSWAALTGGESKLAL